MKYMKYAGALAALAMAAGMASAAHATTYNLNVDGSGNNSFPTSVGTVEVVDAADGGLDFTVTLTSPYTFHSNGNHTSFAFTLNGDGAGVAVTDLTTNNSATFTYLGSGSYPDPSITNTTGNLEYGFDCSTCTGNGPYATTLHFVITATDGSQLSLVNNNDSGIYGAANIRNSNTTNTGAVGFTLETPGVPEPATWAMMIFGLGMVGAGLRMRRRSALTPA